MNLLDILKGIWSFILGSLRIILFLILFVLALLSALSLVITIYKMPKSDEIGLPDHYKMSRNIFEGFIFLAILLIGCHGSFYKNHRNLKLFSILCSLYAAFIIIDLQFIATPDKIARINEEFLDEMTKLESKYDWDHDSYDHDRIIATKRWDSLQSLVCCGIEGPDDWIEFRPKSKSEVYPKTCCVQGLITGNRFCRIEDGLFDEGCARRIRSIVELQLILNYGLIILLIVLTLMACLITKFDLEKLSRTTESATIITSGQNNLTLHVPGGQEYNRFDNSVYIRQPPINEAHNDTKSAQIYPNAYDGEKSQPPPPSYNIGGKY